MKAKKASPQPGSPELGPATPLRMTKPRQAVYSLLRSNRDHPTAQEIFFELQKDLPGVSLATVYNALEALTVHKLIKQVNFDREPSRFCSNCLEHGHFHDEASGQIYDIPFKPGVDPRDFLDLPEGATISSMELTIRGITTKPQASNTQ